MGGSGWHHFVPYDSDLARALQELREAVFASGDYYSRKKTKPASIKELLKASGEGGTHSVLDVSKILDQPLPQPFLTWLTEFNMRTGTFPREEESRRRTLDEVHAIGGVGPLGDERLVALFGSPRPTRADVEAKLYEIFAFVPRGCGAYVVLYENDQPHEIAFLGKTGD